MEVGGKTAVITGGGSGIGRAMPVRLAGEGAALLATDLDEAGARETVRLIESAGGRAGAVRVDVTATCPGESSNLRKSRTEPFA